jgi:hypothetical protein
LAFATVGAEEPELAVVGDGLDEQPAHNNGIKKRSPPHGNAMASRKQTARHCDMKSHSYPARHLAVSIND